jgi:hypothetical protein
MRFPVALGLALVTLGDVMVRNEIPANDAWSDEYRAEHVAYLKKNEVPQEVIDELVYKSVADLFSLMQTS